MAFLADFPLPGRRNLGGSFVAAGAAGAAGAACLRDLGETFNELVFIQPLS
jgi:hypothetical protein